MASFGYVFQLAADATATVLAGTDVPFSNNGPLSNATHTPGTAPITITNNGTYAIQYSLSISAGIGAEIALRINTSINLSTRIPVLVAAGEISGFAILSLAAGDVVTLRNNSAVPLTLSLAPSVGGQLNILQIA